MIFVSCVSQALASVHCCLVVSCLEGADLLALVGDVYCNFVTFPCCILGQVWYLIVSLPDLCHLSYFYFKISECEEVSIIIIVKVKFICFLCRIVSYTWL